MVTEQAQEQEVVEIQPRYFIDLNWYQEQGRSFVALATSRLCPVSRKKEKSKSDAALLRVIKQCCSKREGFITPTMPLLEIVFRQLLANGNQPLGLDQIQEQLQKYLGDTSAKDISLPKLKRIIENDRYYGLKPAPESEEK
ncbi:MAG TPA: hypothetical protein VMW64_01285 [Dehalococcoidia bacterium]|nr:hypothetical protein [Dehalococcoidia bacterium]